MDDIIKTVKSLEKSDLLIDGVTETIKHEIKNQEGGFLGAMIAPTTSSLMQLVVSSLVNAVTGKGVMRAEKEQEGGLLWLLALSLMMKVLGKEVTRSGKRYNNMKQWIKNFFPLHHLSNIEITKYFNYEPKFDGVFSRDSLPRIKDLINLDDKQSKETHWVSLFIDIKAAVYFDSFGIEFIPEEVLNKIKDKSLMHYVFKRQS